MKQLAFITVDQFELLQACAQAIPNKHIVHANLAQWDAFNTLPENIQDALKHIVKQGRFTEHEKEIIKQRKHRQHEEKKSDQAREKEEQRRLHLEAAEKRRNNNNNNNNE
jgi:hypothetical protein